MYGWPSKKKLFFEQGVPTGTRVRLLEEVKLDDFNTVIPEGDICNVTGFDSSTGVYTLVLSFHGYQLKLKLSRAQFSTTL